MSLSKAFVLILLLFLAPVPLQAAEDDSIGFDTERVLSLREKLSTHLPAVQLTPDLPFYYLKLGKEKVLSFLHRKADEQISYRIGVAEARLAEAVVMADEQKYDIAEKLLQKYEHEANRIQEDLWAANFSSVQSDPLIAEISESLHTYKAVLDEMEAKNVADAQKNERVEEITMRGKKESERQLRSLFSTTISSEDASDDADLPFVSPLQ